MSTTGWNPIGTVARARGGDEGLLQVGQGLLLGARAHGGGGAMRRHRAKSFLFGGVGTKGESASVHFLFRRRPVLSVLSSGVFIVS